MYQASDTNSAQKVCRILRVLSTPQPLRLADISAEAGLNKATTLRLLETLISEGFIQRDTATKRYSLGDEALVLGVAMQGRDHTRDRAVRRWFGWPRCRATRCCCPPAMGSHRSASTASSAASRTAPTTSTSAATARSAPTKSSRC